MLYQNEGSVRNARDGWCISVLDHETHTNKMLKVPSRSKNQIKIHISDVGHQRTALSTGLVPKDRSHVEYLITRGQIT